MVMVCGGINGFGFLLCFKVLDLYYCIGKCIFLYFVFFILVDFGICIDGFYGVFQLVYFDYFLWMDGIIGVVGFKMEVLLL